MQVGWSWRLQGKQGRGWYQHLAHAPEPHTLSGRSVIITVNTVANGGKKKNNKARNKEKEGKEKEGSMLVSPLLSNENTLPWWVCPPDRELSLRSK